MALTNLIDLIAEVAAKRIAKEGKTGEDTPEQARTVFPPILAIFGRFHDSFAG
ncbi:hypothetical protein [Oceaniglobus indicus]|uniref:hypothetical protein n=1 Tax=Oceaniglobus indicus TaxID=2047749 RepID=UPI0013045735|nr:hypothetical protein [Oceaniglobus indicus]